MAEEDITLLSLFADALDRAAGPDAESGALAKVLAGLGEDGYPWPEGDAATVARWARSALAPAFHSPFEGSLGAADQALLSAVLDRAEGQARMVLSMTRAAAEPDEAA
ncbi:hypothetical protein BV309_00480 [Streptomyces clavuligerus]|nr:hypothetical protein D1794_29310 [Streptomyces clavuligerus]EDY48712.1 conserved hypothetical protein [Streptomyces clavuligerus]MBY6300997.1 hypothetical protein [Streptomyces clavuligerus]QPJ97080.1 hypothetical protein GE265_28170 [Streptomyces clavuligerus]